MNELATLSSHDDLPVSLEDRLLSRDLKARMFGKEGVVEIGRYEVLEQSGSGAMGTVFRALDPELGRTVALKVLRADRGQAHQRMLTEARALARLSHPNVVTIHEVGSHEDRVFLAMEFIEGLTLRQWLQERTRSHAEILAVFVQAARGLAAAHAAGLVHRDFKPENVLIGTDGRARVVDFGVVKAGEEEVVRSGALPLLPATLTATGQLLGTPSYMAVEQFEGRLVDARADVFALCVALYEALTGQRPFAGNDVSELYQAVSKGEHAPLRVDGVDKDVVRLIERGLSPDPDRRPTLAELIAAIDQRPKRSRRLPWAIGSALMLLGGLGVLTGRAAPRRSGTAAAAAEPKGEAQAQPQATMLAATDDDHEEREAYDAMLAATDDDARLAAAAQFIERGNGTDPARRAVAHSLAGQILWTRSCPESEGLCVRPRDTSKAAASPCFEPRFAPLERIPRSAEVTEAQAHLEAAKELAGIEPPSDPSLAEQWRDASGAAIVLLADARLEHYFELGLPESLDFEGAQTLSNEAAKLAITTLIREGQELVVAYRRAKATTPRWEIAAGARTGMAAEWMAETMATSVPPASLGGTQRDEYCNVLAKTAAHPRKIARGTYTLCRDEAEEHGLTASPDAKYCAERLAAIGDEPE